MSFFLKLILVAWQKKNSKIPQHNVPWKVPRKFTEICQKFSTPLWPWSKVKKKKKNSTAPWRSFWMLIGCSDDHRGTDVFWFVTSLINKHGRRFQIKGLSVYLSCFNRKNHDGPAAHSRRAVLLAPWTPWTPWTQHGAEISLQETFHSAGAARKALHISEAFCLFNKLLCGKWCHQENSQSESASAVQSAVKSKARQTEIEIKLKLNWNWFLNWNASNYYQLHVIRNNKRFLWRADKLMILINDDQFSRMVLQ